MKLRPAREGKTCDTTQREGKRVEKGGRGGEGKKVDETAENGTCGKRTNRLLWRARDHDMRPPMAQLETWSRWKTPWAWGRRRR